MAIRFIDLGTQTTPTRSFAFYNTERAEFISFSGGKQTFTTWADVAATESPNPSPEEKQFFATIEGLLPDWAKGIESSE